ncbi:BgTH12-05693 [Blumeria graminis f. sp. triticale]|uniref:RING-type E3 ubiquitin transferase n=1 Tax=Blumeria graminis f. sp. triticale TaxID=1689686 RepID=A0A9W4D3B5_BLUGR|nr:BgTH12-05693 [Blumeria graminis f. sp. triticale]
MVTPKELRSPSFSRDRPLPPLPDSDSESLSSSSENLNRVHAKLHCRSDGAIRSIKDSGQGRNPASELYTEETSSTTPNRHLAPVRRNSSHFRDASLEDSYMASDINVARTQNISGHDLHEQNGRFRRSSPLNKTSHSVTSAGHRFFTSQSGNERERDLKFSSFPISSGETSSNVQHYLERRHTRNNILPTWQLDTEVSICPLCNTQFSFFLRKHHCRKCGRVVCNSCSPHRIIIPNRYIIQPPVEGVTRRLSDLGLAENLNEDSSGLNNTMGGEKVRLCNPCVPSLSSTSPRYSPDEIECPIPTLQNSNDLPNTPLSHSALNSYRHRDVENITAPNSSRHYRQQYIHSGNRVPIPRSNNLFYSASYNRGEDRISRSNHHEIRSRSSTVGALSDFNHGNNSEIISLVPPFHGSHSIRQLRQEERSVPFPSRPSQISEEDECWICHQELPSRSLENHEMLRKNHVNDCVNAAIESTSGVVQKPSVELTFEQEFVNIDHNNGNSTAIGTGSQNYGHIQNLHVTSGRRTGVFPYRALETDCINSAECTICFEEFKVDDWMGRLECFCQFHLKCIRQWFEMRPGQCPVHQHGSG